MRWRSPRITKDQAKIIKRPLLESRGAAASRVGNRVFLIVIAGLLLLSNGAEAGGSPGPSHFRNRLNQQVTPYEFYGFGAPLPKVASNATDLANFNNGLLNFQEVETLNPANAASGPAGQLGPLFNNTSCAACHSNPTRGGGGLSIAEQRLSTGGPPVKIFAVDHMLFGGPESQGSIATVFELGQLAPPLGAQVNIADNVPSACQEVELARGFSPALPTCIADGPNDTGLTGTPTCVAHRESLPLFGDGLVEATADSTFEAIAKAQPTAIRGVVRMVADIDNFDGLDGVVSAATRSALSTPHVARFGWKDDFSTLVGFSADAYLNEIGITSDLNSVPNTTCALGAQQFGVTLQTADDPEDTVDSSGRADIDRFTDFMRALQPPPQAPSNSSVASGSRLFSQIGCAGCHTPSITTASNPAAFVPPTINGTPISSNVNRALASVTYQPFGDFLLHDMGSLGDGVNDDPSIPNNERLMRTMPLWGLRAREVFLHDGRATDLPTAITLHDGQGKAAAQSFQALSATNQQNLINFLDTL